MMDSEFADFRRLHHVDDAAIENMAEVELEAPFGERPRVMKGKRLSRFQRSFPA
jgi:hypothetical protein